MNTIADYTKDFSDGNKLSYEDFVRKRCKWYNETEGDLPYINCDICKNKGYIAELDTDLNEIRVECKCMSKRKSIKNLELSGLGNLIKKYTFNAYETSKPWQSEIKKKALLFTQNSGDSWFYAAGQSGSGKTHICTAICTRFISVSYTHLTLPTTERV